MIAVGPHSLVGETAILPVCFLNLAKASARLSAMYMKTQNFWILNFTKPKQNRHAVYVITFNAIPVDLYLAPKSLDNVINDE